ncbi:MAG: energy-coupling factor transporter ATPase [Christensenellales bacterium]|jgi:energy-coupling factor transport system ATP-binding protein
MPIVIENMYHLYMPGTPYESSALREISLTIEEGAFVGLIGHTGSGKSTLVQHLNGLLMPTSGKVSVDGVDITQKGADLMAVRRKVGMVFQYPEHQLFEETVEKDIAFGPSNMGVRGDELTGRVQKAMAQVGLDYEQFRDRSPFELSGGQRRRVAIAGVLAMEPKYLVLDEPTAGLDPRGRRELLDLVCDLHERQGITVLMVTHSMDDIVRVAREIVVLSHGRIVMADRTERIFSRARELMEIGLDIPDVVRLSRAMKPHGVHIPETMFDPAEVAACIASQMGGEGTC